MCVYGRCRAVLGAAHNRDQGVYEALFGGISFSLMTLFEPAGRKTRHSASPALSLTGCRPDPINLPRAGREARVLGFARPLGR
jgi:hypothetical protein